MRTKRKCRYGEEGMCEVFDDTFCDGNLPSGGCKHARRMTKETRDAIGRDMMESTPIMGYKVWDHPSFEYRVTQLLGNGNINLFAKKSDRCNIPNGKFVGGQLKVVIRNVVYILVSCKIVPSGDFKGYRRIVVRPTK